MGQKSRQKRQRVATKPGPRGLPVQQLPDLSRRDAIRGVMDAARQESLAPGLAVVGNMTDDQRAVMTASDELKRLLGNPDVRAVVDAMIAFRQGYAVAYRELQELLDADRSRFPEGTLYPPVEDFTIQYAMYMASKPFTEQMLLQAFGTQVLPWLVDVTDKHTALDAAQATTERLEAEAAWRQRPLDIGFAHTPCQDQPGLERCRALVLVGWGNAVRWLLDRAATTAYQAGAQVVCFQHTEPRREQAAGLVVIKSEHWSGCCNSTNTWQRVLRERVVDKLAKTPDLLLVDDLAAAYTQFSIKNRPSPALAGDAHRVLKRCYDQAGFALLAGLPQPTKDSPDLTTPDFEQLRTFTLLRPVHVQEHTPEQYRIVVGNQAASFDVAKEELDGYPAPGRRLVGV